MHSPASIVACLQAQSIGACRGEAVLPLSSSVHPPKASPLSTRPLPNSDALRAIHSAAAADKFHRMMAATHIMSLPNAPHPLHSRPSASAQHGNRSARSCTFPAQQDVRCCGGGRNCTGGNAVGMAYRLAQPGLRSTRFVRAACRLPCDDVPLWPTLSHSVLIQPPKPLSLLIGLAPTSNASRVASCGTVSGPHDEQLVSTGPCQMKSATVSFPTSTMPSHARRTRGRDSSSTPRRPVCFLALLLPHRHRKRNSLS